ncbi:MAG: hypothetical protein WBF50_18620, partial [Pseudolabrys sp.]
QDLLVELIEYSWHVVFFLALVFFVWASTTHYTARLLLDTDERFRARVAERNTDFIKGWEILLPRLLGALAFVAVFLSAERSQWCFVCDRPRILTTVLASDYHPKATCPVAGAMKTDANIKATAAQIFKSAVSGPARQCSIFLESVRFHDLLANKNPPNRLGRIQRLAVWDYVRNKLPFLTPRNLDDIRLSTAAHNSARFPIVSPAGEIRNRQHQVVDRIVDGGYFENYGALGAMELAQAIRAIEPKLAPFVLVISNDPDEDPDLTKVDLADDAVLADVSVPIAAVVNTRTSRGRLAVGQLEAAMESVAEPDCGGGTAHIRVWPRFQQTANGDLENVSRPISMSWWLSRPIQILLHQQTEENKNQNKNQDQIERVWRAIMSKSDCTR